MRVAELLRGDRPIFSFEFFPPKTEAGWDRLFHTIRDELLPLEPAYVSVTYGAGGSTRERTHSLVTRIQREFGLTVVAHLTCVGSTAADIAEILTEYDQAGVHNVLALRGDPPSSATGMPRELLGPDGHGSPDFPHAADLVAFIRRRFPHFSIGVAGFPEGHPDARNRLVELEHLKAKVDAGADYIVTQLFFDNHDFYDYRERCRLAGIGVPMIAGIMPVTTHAGMMRMADLSAGSRFPAALLRLLGRARDEAGFTQAGIHWATAQVADLLNHDVAGVHLYTLNHSPASLQICRALGLSSYRL